MALLPVMVVWPANNLMFFSFCGFDVSLLLLSWRLVSGLSAKHSVTNKLITQFPQINPPFQSFRHRFPPGGWNQPLRKQHFRALLSFSAPTRPRTLSSALFPNALSGTFYCSSGHGGSRRSECAGLLATFCNTHGTPFGTQACVLPRASGWFDTSCCNVARQNTCHNGSFFVVCLRHIAGTMVGCEAWLNNRLIAISCSANLNNKLEKL